MRFPEYAISEFDEFIRSYYGKITYSDMANRIGKSVKFCKHRVEKLGIKIKGTGGSSISWETKRKPKEEKFCADCGTNCSVGSIRCRPCNYRMMHSSPAMLGKRHTSEAKAKMSESHKGKIVSEETKKKISDSDPVERI